MQQEIVDSVLKAAVNKIAEEVASLLGEDFKLSAPRFQTVNKQAFFAVPRDRCALSRVVGAGDFSGEAAILVPLRDAVLLGGTLIMLPEEELAERCKNPEISGEEGDAFGEVANIIVGAVTAVFEDLYPKKLHFKKTSHEVLVPTKVDLDGEQPFPPGQYHLTTCTMSLAGKTLGDLELLFPFALLGMPLPVDQAADANKAAPKPAMESTAKRAVAAEGSSGQAAAKKTVDATLEERQAAAGVARLAEEPPAPAPAVPDHAADSEQPKGIDRTIVDNVLQAAVREIAKDVSDLLGHAVSCTTPSSRLISKVEYLGLPRDKGALARMSLRGDYEGNAFIIVRQRDAIRFGGTLIMLPEEELAAKIKGGDFQGEEGDAYGEVANIISGSLTKVFDDLFPRKLHLKREEVEAFLPTKCDPQGSAPFPPGTYYLTTCQLALESKALGELDLLFPIDALGVQPDAAAQKPTDGPMAAQTTPASRSATAAPERPPQGTSISAADLAALQDAAHAPDEETAGAAADTVLIVADQIEAAQTIGEWLETHNRPHLILHFQDNLKQALNGHRVSGAFLVMKQVGEQGFAVAIKIKSALPKNVPLIMAGPQWTRSNVLQAVRYGARDILITPAEPDDIAEKFRKHISTD